MSSSCPASMNRSPAQSDEKQAGPPPADDQLNKGLALLKAKNS